MAREWEKDAYLEKDLIMIENLAFSFAGDACFLMATNWDKRFEAEFHSAEVVGKLRQLVRHSSRVSLSAPSRFELPGLPSEYL